MNFLVFHSATWIIDPVRCLGKFSARNNWLWLYVCVVCGCVYLCVCVIVFELDETNRKKERKRERKTGLLTEKEERERVRERERRQPTKKGRQHVQKKRNYSLLYLTMAGTLKEDLGVILLLIRRFWNKEPWLPQVEDVPFLKERCVKRSMATAIHATAFLKSSFNPDDKNKAVLE